MFSLTRFAFKNSCLFILLLVLLVGMGLYKYANFPSQEDPTFTVREAVVTAAYPGMSAERVENLITRRLEEKIREIPEVEFIKASSKTDISIIHVNVYDQYYDLQPIWDQLRNKMDEVKSQLPSGTRGPFVNDDFGDVAIASLALTADGFNLTEMYDTAVDIRRELYTVPGVKRVTMYGVQEEVIVLSYSNAKLAEYGLTPQLLISTLKQANTILPGGKVEIFGRQIIIEPSGNFTSEDEIRNVQIAVPNNAQPVYLRDIVEVEREYIDPPKMTVYHMGEPAIILGVSMVEGENILDVGDDLAKRVQGIEQDLPIGYNLSWATFQSELVRNTINDFSWNLYQTLGIVLLVVVFFLGTRTGLIVGLGVPLTMLTTLLIMNMFGVALHRVSIAALIISLGLLVDNGIVVAEDIKRRIAEGMKRDEAAIAAGDSLVLPLLTSSLTTILAFVPLILAEHRAGEYLFSIAQVVAITLLSSWFLATTITPLLCARFMKVDSNAAPEEDINYDTRFYVIYRRFLDRVLSNRVGFLIGMVLLMVLSAMLLKTVPKQFFPASDRAQFTIYLDMGRGASINQTDEKVQELNAWLLDKSINPEVTNVVSYVGDGGPRFYLSLSPFDPDPHMAFVLVDLESFKQVEGFMSRTREFVLKNIPEANADVKTLSMGPTEVGVILLRIVGPDPYVLYDLAQDVKRDLQDIPGTMAIEDDWGNKTLGVHIEIDQTQANRSNISPADVAISLNAFYTGSEITDYREQDKIIPIILRGEEEERTTIDRLRTVNVFSQRSNASVPLLQIAEFVPDWKLSHLQRRNFEHTITVSARNPDMYASELAAELAPYLDETVLPPGYRFEWGGELEDSVKAQQALFANLPLCLFLGFVLLVWQFNSFKRPMIVVLTIPLLVIGGALGLVVMHATLGFVALLGFLSLGGILINNAIVLIDRIDQEIAEGKLVREAVVQASLKRFRPIMMTTLTTVLGLLPLILFGGEMWYGMASVIAYGLAVGTVLTLGVVPALYTLLIKDKANVV
jgi:multidrug efflux pump subunit AcrB